MLHANLHHQPSLSCSEAASMHVVPFPQLRSIHSNCTPGKELITGEVMFSRNQSSVGNLVALMKRAV